MKSLFLLLIISSIFIGTVALAGINPRQCTTVPATPTWIQSSAGMNDIVYLFSDAARDLYIELPGTETVETSDSRFFIKSKGGVNCERQDLSETVSGMDSACANYQCHITSVQI